ncbi:MAG: UbiA family prenyltransferase [Bacteroidetes bacterium]|nr:UbiA family prenyltransferase [Bacteroidota bacterium]
MKYIPVIPWIDKDTLLHLRLPFSFFLMPVFLFALSQAPVIQWPETVLAFLILHLLVFPSSNGYNSYQDKDTTSIGLLKNPPPVSRRLFYSTLAMDILAVFAGLAVSFLFSCLVLTFILVSRAYSYRGIRLKRFPVTAFLIVSLFQGGFVFLMSVTAITDSAALPALSGNIIYGMAISSLFIGSIYPLTQIYQHEADKRDGVITISYKLGYLGTFIFSSLLFLIATVFIYLLFNEAGRSGYFSIFMVMMFPVIITMVWWFIKVMQNTSGASYSNTMKMNVVTSACMNLYFYF